MRHVHKCSWFSTFLAALLLLGGCGDDPPEQTPTDTGSTTTDVQADTESGDVGADTEADTSLGDDAGDAGGDVAQDNGNIDEPDVPEPLTPGSLRWDLETSLASDFFAFPYPSNARRTETGTPDLGSFPTQHAGVNILEKSLRLIEEGRPGFSPLTPVYFPFTVSVDPSTLPETFIQTILTTSTAFIIDVTPGSPTYGQRQPCTVGYREEVGDYWPATTVVLHPLYQVPLHIETTYAAVLTHDVRGPDDAALAAPSVVARLPELLEGEAPPEDAVALAPLLAALSDDELDLGITLDDVLVATVFTTSDPMADFWELTDWLRDTDVPEATDWTLATADNGAGFEVYEGIFPSYEFFAGTAPYIGFGQGLIEIDDTGAPVTPTEITLRFALSVPTSEMPEGGWPIVLYSHGLGEDYRGFVRMGAEQMAARGVAILGIDPPLQGGRNPTVQADRDLIVTLSVSNIIAGREILRQGVFDEVQAERLVEGGLSIPAEIASGDSVILIDATRVAFMGHSEGAQIGALFLPLSQIAVTGVFSEGGGGAALTMLTLDLPEFNVAEIVGRALGIDEEVEPFDVDHPAVGVVIQPLLDNADPLHSARNLFQAPREGGIAHDLLMLEGFDDPLTPPVSIEALASAATLPIAEPVSREIVGLTYQGIQSAPLPANENLPEVGGRTPTGALRQFPDFGHYIIYFNQPGRAQVFDFLASGLAGSATLSAVPAE